ncbi:hypothetical protein P7H00_06015 [Enterococcus pseudoavium]|uniref:Uncharacterized protein n=1 Tax=Enterococcus pseudoavium TaxID=44007 RepID=A0AAE4I221_9ENTE|nr:hypothetical protein [Enterococcus pseudoavium]MDT2736692.1 hypothetical protein [Enterococcus pseudoavium]MDT2753695.1 hypothetical protein [Enterococcus pseudoavium]MDT2771278.1 hypothetical protein [Enterococcus pseudoavium]
MKKIAGYFFQKPLVLDDKRPFEIHLPTDNLYDGNDSVLESNKMILCEIGKKYDLAIENLHNFFIISEISDVVGKERV